MESLPNAHSSVTIYSSNLPNLFLFRQSEYNKYMRNIKDEKHLAIEGLISSEQDTIHIAREKEEDADAWSRIQKQYFELHGGSLQKFYLDALVGLRSY